VGLRDIAAGLVASYAMHLGKNAATLDRAIRRMFDDGKKSFEGKNGQLTLIEVPSGKSRGPRTVAAIRLQRHITAEEEAALD